MLLERQFRGQENNMLDEKQFKQLLDVEKEIASFLAVLVRRDKTQTDLIKELNNSGLSPKRIAEILGTTANAVRVGLSRSRSQKVWKKK